MPYSHDFIQRVGEAPDTLGSRIGRLAIQRDFPVQKIAKALGVSRQTVYNWFSGTEVFVAYRDRAEDLLNILKSARNADDAWRTMCAKYNLTP